MSGENSRTQSPLGSEISSLDESETDETFEPTTDFKNLKTKVDVLSGVVNHLNKGYNDQTNQTQMFKNQFDTYNDFTNKKMETLSAQFNTRLENIAREFDSKLENQSSDLNTKLDNKFENLKGEMGKITTAMEKQADYILEKLFPLHSAFRDQTKDSNTNGTGHTNSIGNDNVSANQTIFQTQTNCTTENSYSQKPSSAFTPIQTTGIRYTPMPNTSISNQPAPIYHPQAEKPVHVPIEPITSICNSGSKDNQNAEKIGYTKPNSFDGKSSWSDYKVHFEIVASLNGWSNETKALKLIACMKDSALSTIGNINTNCPPSYHELINTLTRRFAPENQAELYKHQIDARIRKRGESLPELAQDIKRLVRLAYPQAQPDVWDSLAYRSFREALNDYDLAWAITQLNMDTIDEALTLALKYEAFHASHRKPTFRKMASDNMTTDKNHSKGDTCNYKSKGTCYYCGEQGHFKTNCEKRKRDNERFVQHLKGNSQTSYYGYQGSNRLNSPTKTKETLTYSGNS